MTILADRLGSEFDRQLETLLSKGYPGLAGRGWAGNPHSWLGSASCPARLGAAA